MAGGVFICYRRDDSAGWARSIYDRLTRRFEREQVFIDVDNIEPGLDFVKILSDWVGGCDALIAIIGKRWFSRQHNRRRIDDRNDFVRIEIEAALKRDIRVIPVLVDGAFMPSEEVLPDPLKPLARRMGIEISHTRFDSDAERLIKALAFVAEGRVKRDLAGVERAPQVEVRSKRRAWVMYDLQASPARFVASVPPLKSLYPTKETLKDIRFVVRDGQPPVLVVKIPDDLPAGVYTGPIVDAETREPKGFIRVRVEDDER